MKTSRRDDVDGDGQTERALEDFPGTTLERSRIRGHRRVALDTNAKLRLPVRLARKNDLILGSESSDAEKGVLVRQAVESGSRAGGAVRPASQLM